MVGVRAITIAFPSARGLSAHPSRMIRPASGTEEGDMRLFLGDVCRLRTLGTLGYLERDLVPFLQASKAVPDNGAVVDEHVGTSLALDEPETFRLVEPLHTACFRHDGSTLLSTRQHLRRHRADHRHNARGPYRSDPRLGHEKHDIHISPMRRKACPESEKHVIEKIPQPENPERPRDHQAKRRPAEKRNRGDHDERRDLAPLFEPLPRFGNRVKGRSPSVRKVQLLQAHDARGLDQRHRHGVDGEGDHPTRRTDLDAVTLRRPVRSTVGAPPRDPASRTKPRPGARRTGPPPLPRAGRIAPLRAGPWSRGGSAGCRAVPRSSARESRAMPRSPLPRREKRRPRGGAPTAEPRRGKAPRCARIVKRARQPCTRPPRPLPTRCARSKAPRRASELQRAARWTQPASPPRRTRAAPPPTPRPSRSRIHGGSGARAPEWKPRRRR